MPRLESKETLCALCRPSKRIVGANTEGCRTSLICHRALQHGELRLALETDQSVTGDFITRLFSDEDRASTGSGKSDDVSFKKEYVKEEELKDSEKERELIKEEVKRKVLQKLVEIKNTRKQEKGKKRKKLDKMQELELRLAEKMRRSGGGFF